MREAGEEKGDGKGGVQYFEVVLDAGEELSILPIDNSYSKGYFGLFLQVSGLYCVPCHSSLRGVAVGVM